MATKKHTHATCLYDWETGDFFCLHTGTEEECEKVAAAYAAATGVPRLQEPTEVEDASDGDGSVSVRPLVEGMESAIVKVYRARHNAYGADCIKIGYDFEKGEPDRIWFVPVNPSRFKPGDKVIMAQFRASAPGGWVVRSLEDFSYAEYWQENTIER
jgi:hypothetical protein